MIFLQGHGWFDEKVKFAIHGVDPFDEVRATGWAEEWSRGASADLRYYLEDVCSEIEDADQEFSREWYYAKIAHLYFSDKEIPDVAMTIGILLAQLWWKIEHEGAAERGQANEASLSKASEARRSQSILNSDAKNRIIVKYWRDAFAEFGAEVMRKDSNAAQAIYTLAERKRPKELLVKSTGEVIGVEAIRKRVCAMRKLKKIG